MKEKLKRIIKSPMAIIIGLFVIPAVLSLGTSYAANVYLYDSKDVSYDNTKSGIIATDVQGAVDELYACASDYSGINTRLTSVENQIYPVGSIYISVNNTNPGTLFGGTWESFGEGRTLVGVGTGTDANSFQKVFTSNETGGEYNHTLTVNEMPSHYHNSQGFASVAHTYGQPYNALISNGNSTSEHTMSTGGSQSHNNIQPYITVYMWKRTA